MILFLCTGNYYRSRLAEELFNHLAAVHGITRRAASRGIAEDFTPFRNPGNISPLVLEQLAARGIAPLRAHQPPQSLNETDLQSAAHIVALCRAEHYPMMLHRFPDWAERITYWDIPDYPQMPAPQAAAHIELYIRTLMAGFECKTHSSTCKSPQTNLDG